MLPVMITDGDCREINLRLVWKVDASNDRVLKVVWDDTHKTVDSQEWEEGKECEQRYS